MGWRIGIHTVAHGLSGSEDERKYDAYFEWNRRARIASKQASSGITSEKGNVRGEESGSGRRWLLLLLLCCCGAGVGKSGGNSTEKSKQKKIRV